MIDLADSVQNVALSRVVVFSKVSRTSQTQNTCHIAPEESILDTVVTKVHTTYQFYESGTCGVVLIQGEVRTEYYPVRKA